MADFVKVMTEAQRMCHAQPCCNGCPVDFFGICGFDMSELEASPEEIVELVMHWAKTHPQKTMLTELLDKFPTVERMSNGAPRVCPHHLNPAWDSGCDICKGDCFACWNRPLPEESC